MKRYQKGFTLAELITVIIAGTALLSVLTLIVLAILWLIKAVF